MMICFIILWSLFSSFSNDEVRENYVRDYQKVMSSYKDASSLSFKVTYRSFDWSPAKPDTTLTVYYALKGKNFYSKAGAKETYQNNQYYVSVNHALKAMAVSRASFTGTDGLPFDKIDTLLILLKSTINYSTVNQGKTGRYIIETKERGDINKSKIVLEFSLSTYRVSRYVVYLYGYVVDPYAKEKSSHVPYIEMLFSDYTVGNIKDETFSTAKYFTEKAPDEIKLKPPYTHYELINSLPYNSSK